MYVVIFNILNNFATVNLSLSKKSLRLIQLRNSYCKALRGFYYKAMCLGNKGRVYRGEIGRGGMFLFCITDYYYKCGYRSFYPAFSKIVGSSPLFFKKSF